MSRNPLFQIRLDEVKAFKAEHGHTNIHHLCSSKGNKRNTLYSWLRLQRARYKALPDCFRRYRVMTQAEIDALDAIGFEWDRGPTDRSLTQRPTFWEMLESLKDFKHEHGHTNVHYGLSKRDKTLYCFINQQRLRRTALPHAYHQSRIMVQEEIDALDDIGFQWTPTPVDRRNFSSFSRRVDELKAFKHKHGHLNMCYDGAQNTTENSLHRWAQVQRQRYKAIPIRHHSHAVMIPEEIDALNAIGFDWEPPPVR